MSMNFTIKFFETKLNKSFIKEKKSKHQAAK